MLVTVSSTILQSHERVKELLGSSAQWKTIRHKDFGEGSIRESEVAACGITTLRSAAMALIS